MHFDSNQQKSTLLERGKYFTNLLFIVLHALLILMIIYCRHKSITTNATLN
jgi:hypothetical protein